MSLKGQMTPEIFQIFTRQLYYCTLNVEKFEGRKGKLSPVRHQRCMFPSRKHEPSSEFFGLWGVCVQTFVKHANFFTTSSWWHDITSTKVSCVSNYLFEIKMPCHSMLNCVIAVRPICLKIPTNLLHMELNRRQVHKI